MKVAVTGASGFLGTFVLNELQNAGHHVVALSRTFGPKRSDVEWIALDLMDGGATRDVLSKIRPDAVAHLAWVATPGAFWSDPANLDWVAASLRLFRAAARTSCAAFVTTGSCAEYGTAASPLREDEAPLSGASLYAVSKRSLFTLISKAVETPDAMRVAWGRVFYPFGPGEPKDKFLSYVMGSALRGDSVILREPHRQLDYVYAADVASGIRALVERSDARGAFNIGSGVGSEVLALARTAAMAVGVDPDIVRAEATGTPSQDIIADVTRLRSLGWIPKHSIDVGIAELARTISSPT